MKPAEHHCCHKGDDADAETATDPVCGMRVALDGEHQLDHDGQRYRFCCAGCVTKFRADPERYLSGKPEPTGPADAMYGCPMHPDVQQIGPGSCPDCGMALDPLTISLDDDDDPELRDMNKRLAFALVFSLPLLSREEKERIIGANAVEILGL